MKKLIMLVEDNPSDVNLTQRALDRRGVKAELVVLRDGQEALDYLFAEGAYAERNMTVMPHLILLDLKMPKVDGVSVLQRVKKDKRTQTIPVVILTTSNEEGDMRACYAQGANSYIQKPVDFMQFADVVSQVGQYWLTLNETPPHHPPEV